MGILKPPPTSPRPIIHPSSIPVKGREAYIKNMRIYAGPAPTFGTTAQQATGRLQAAFAPKEELDLCCETIKILRREFNSDEIREMLAYEFSTDEVEEHLKCIPPPPAPPPMRGEFVTTSRQPAQIHAALFMSRNAPTGDRGAK